MSRVDAMVRGCYFILIKKIDTNFYEFLRIDTKNTIVICWLGICGLFIFRIA